MIQNGQLFAVFNSAHRVMKAEFILKKCGLEILLVPAPRALSTDCGLAIRYSSDLNDSVIKALSAEKLLPDLIYLKKNDSQYEPVMNEITIKESGN